MRCYDGSDQEFWRSFYRPIYELPLRYHAHTNLRMAKDEWFKIKLIHAISNFEQVDKTPLALRRRFKYFGPNYDWLASPKLKSPKLSPQ